MQNVRRYQCLAVGTELLESQLPESVPEFLNAEIVLQTVTDVSLAITWLSTSFMYVRVSSLLDQLLNFCREVGIE